MNSSAGPDGPDDQTTTGSQHMPAGPDDYKLPPVNPTAVSTRSKLAPGEFLSKRVTYIAAAGVVLAIVLIAMGLGVFGGQKNAGPVPQNVTMATPPGNNVDNQGDLDHALPTPPPDVKGVFTAAPVAGQPNAQSSASDELAESLNAASSPAPIPTFASTTPAPLPTNGDYNNVPPPANNPPPSVPNPGNANITPQSPYRAPAQPNKQLCVGNCVEPDTTVPTAAPLAQTDRTAGSGPVAPAGGTLYEPQPTTNQAAAAGGEFGQSVQANAAGRKDVTNNNIDFANTKSTSEGYLIQTQHAPIGKYEIWAGNVIPAELDTGINTNLPGLATAHVTQDVYDSRTGQFLLIPKGTRIVGVYNSTVDQGQNRIQIKWSRMIWLDGKYISLEDMSGGDREGNSGLFADVQDHRGAVLGASLITAVLAAGTQLASGGSSSGTYTTGNNGSVVFQSVGQSIAQQGGQIVQQKISQAPELTVPRGENFNIIVDRTMVLPPWTYGG